MESIENLFENAGFLVFARFSVTAFFAIVFLQSGLNKLVDSEGNKAYLQESFSQAPTLQSIMGSLFWGLTALELAAGIFSGLALITFSFWDGGFFARWAMRFVFLALLALMFGQRLAKDYGGAAVVASYFGVALLGSIVFSLP